jgi:FG-GAP-like repeat
MRPLLFTLLLAVPAAAQNLSMDLVTTPTWPGGLAISKTNGVCWADFDGDGWVDFFGARAKQLWRNRDGQDWELTIVPNIVEGYRYGSAAGDYDNNGLPDLATEPRAITNERMDLLRNLGDLLFEEVGQDSQIVDSLPYGDSETNAWCDVDFDGFLDLSVPVYPAWAMGGGPGNFFLHNQGPTGPGGAYRFLERSLIAGLDNPPGTSRPEGTEFCDVDGDGDTDLFTGGTLFQNISGVGVPLFRDASDTSGIVKRDLLEEGLCFFDMDLDGDQDLLILYCQPTEARVYENSGDGTFKLRPKNWFEGNGGSCLGMSKVDWDNDGDLDLTTQNTLRRNLFMETGQRRFGLETHNIPADHMTNSTIAWADWDKDGDQDLLLGTWSLQGYLYDNALYGADTPPQERRHVRVRIVRDSDSVDRGLETEFGAFAELTLHDEPGRLRRRQFVTSAAGYVNQNEYTLHFALPPAPDPGDGEDWIFDLHVDFPSEPAVGVRRVDRHVNPVLSGISLADLDDREIWVYRSGRVRLNGCDYAPIGGVQPVMTATTGGLALVTDQAGLPDVVDAPADDWWVGVEFDTTLASAPQRLREVILDGVAAQSPEACTGDGGRLVLWDVTDATNALQVAVRDLPRYVRNDRGAYRTNLLLEPGKTYRLLAKVDSLRGTPISAPVIDGPLTTHGGLSFQDGTPCDDTEVLAAGTDSSQVYLSLRFSEDSGSTWVDLGNAHPGSGGPAVLGGSGAADPGTSVLLSLSAGPPSAPTILVSSTRAFCRPMGGGILIPAPDVFTLVPTDAGGAWTLPVDVPVGTLPGTTFYFQTWWIDGGAAGGRAGSNAISVTSPY